MTFKVKMDDKKIKVDIEKTALKDILQYCKPKEQLVLFKKFGLSGGKGISLQKIGKDYGLTRERVRQIESQGLMRFRRLIVGNEKYLKVIEEAKKILEANGGILSEDDLIAKVINKGMFRFNANELRLILVSDFDMVFLKRNKNFKKCFYIEPIFEDLLNKIAGFVLGYFQKENEYEDVYEFIDKLKSNFQNQFNDIKFLSNNLFYINLLKSIRAIRVFDGKVGLDSCVEVNPKTIKLKVIYLLRMIKKPMHYQEIASKIMEWFPEKPVKVNTVHNELVKNTNVFVNMGLGIYGLKEWGYEGGTVKSIIERVLKSVGRPMAIKEIAKEVLKEKMVSPNTVVLTLQKYKDTFRRVEKGVYELIS